VVKTGQILTMTLSKSLSTVPLGTRTRPPSELARIIRKAQAVGFQVRLFLIRPHRQEVSLAKNYDKKNDLIPCSSYQRPALVPIEEVEVVL